MMPRHPCFLVARSVWLEFVRRKDFYVLLIFVLLFAAAVLAMRSIGIEGPETAAFLLSCGMGLAGALAAILTAAYSARTVRQDLEGRAILPLLAKPVGRTQWLWGKFLGVFVLGAGSLALFQSLAWLPVPKSESQHPLLLVQALALQALGLGALAWLTILLALRLSALASITVSLLVFFLGGPAMDWLIQVARRWGGGAERAAERLLGLAPDFAATNFIERYIQGAAPLAPAAFATAVLYGAAFLLFFAALAAWRVERKPL